MIELEVGIIVVDAEQASRFYVDGMGFTIVQQLSFPQGGVTRLAREGARIKLYRPSSEPQVARTPDNWRTLSGFAYATLHVSSAATALADALVAGAVQIEPVTNHRPGARYAMIADPDGNIWELLEEYA